MYCTGHEDLLDPLPESEVHILSEKLIEDVRIHNIQPREAEELVSGSGIQISGSGDVFVPEPTHGPELFDYTVYLKFTFSSLTLNQYRENSIEKQISDLLITLLGLNSAPSVVYDSESSHMLTSNILVYFPINTTVAMLESYVRILNSTDNNAWRILSEDYVSIV